METLTKRQQINLHINALHRELYGVTKDVHLMFHLKGIVRAALQKYEEGRHIGRRKSDNVCARTIDVIEATEGLIYEV